MPDPVWRWLIDTSASWGPALAGLLFCCHRQEPASHTHAHPRRTSSTHTRRARVRVHASGPSARALARHPAPLALRVRGTLAPVPVRYRRYLWICKTAYTTVCAHEEVSRYIIVHNLFDLRCLMYLLCTKRNHAWTIEWMSLGTGERGRTTYLPTPKLIFPGWMDVFSLICICFPWPNTIHESSLKIYEYDVTKPHYVINDVITYDVAYCSTMNDVNMTSALVIWSRTLGSDRPANSAVVRVGVCEVAFWLSVCFFEEQCCFTLWTPPPATEMSQLHTVQKA